MSGYECKKIWKAKAVMGLLLINLIFCVVFWVQNRGVEKAKSTPALEELYEQIGGEITGENAEQIETLKNRLDNVFAIEASIEEKYNKGKMDIEEYMEYRDEYHAMVNKESAIEAVYEKYLVNRENGSWMIFDGYYNKLLQPDRIPWGLLLSVFLMALLLVYCENKELWSVIAVTRRGSRGVCREKIKTLVGFSTIFTIIFALEEGVISASFYSFRYLSAPVQSVSCLADVKISMSILAWFIFSLFLRIILADVFSFIVFSILRILSHLQTGIQK